MCIAQPKSLAMLDTDLSTRYASFIAANSNKKIQELALSLAHYPEEERMFIVQQIEGIQRMRHKVPQLCQVPGYLFPPRLSLEQCSGAAAALYKANVVKKILQQLRQAQPSQSRHFRFADLTGGMGIDFIHMAPHFDTAIYVERNAKLVDLAQHNFPLLGIQAQCYCGEAEAFLPTLEKVDVLFLDPARRNRHGKKTVQLEDCSPNVVELLPLLLEKCHFLLLKLSTMIDLHSVIAQLACVSEAHVFAERGECKDLLLLCQAQPEKETRIVCANERDSFSFLLREESAAHCPIRTSKLDGFLYEADAAIMKAQAFRSLAQRFGLEKLHPNTHLYCAAQRAENFPGRVLRIVEVLDFSKTTLKRLQTLGKANLSVRNFPQDVATLRKRLKLQEGGEDYLFASTLHPNQKVLIHCRRD